MRYLKNTAKDFDPTVGVKVDHGYFRQVILDIAKSISDKMPHTFDNCDGGLYVGCAGVAYMYYYLAISEPFQDIRDELLVRAKNYSDVALSYAMGKRNKDPPAAFLLGSGGVYVSSSLVCSISGHKESSNELNKKYRALASVCQPVDYLGCGSDEFLVGRAGYLAGAIELNRIFGEVVPKDSLENLCKAVIHSGRLYSQRHKSRSPLMYSYYNTEYLGAAHGLSGILQMLLHFPSYIKSDPSVEKDVHDSVDFLMSLMGASGNVPAAMDEVMGQRQRPESEELVHWCHGGPGVVYLFAKAYLFWKDQAYLDMCMRCAELVWQKGLLKKGPGICHGVAGSGYVFLLLYRLTSNQCYLHRALKFAEFMLSEEFHHQARTPDSPYSLYEGWAGAVCFLTDLLQPHRAEFPLFDVFRD